MSYTVAAKVAAHAGLLTRLAAGESGTAALLVYDGEVLLVTLPIDHASSEVSATTGVLTLAPGAEATVVASGTADSVTLVARDGTVLNDGIEVEEGVSEVAGKVVLSSLSLVADGTVTLVSAAIG